MALVKCGVKHLKPRADLIQLRLRCRASLRVATSLIFIHQEWMGRGKGLCTLFFGINVHWWIEQKWVLKSKQGQCWVHIDFIHSKWFDMIIITFIVFQCTSCFTEAVRAHVSCAGGSASDCNNHTHTHTARRRWGVWPRLMEGHKLLQAFSAKSRAIENPFIRHTHTHRLHLQLLAH